MNRGLPRYPVMHLDTMHHKVANPKLASTIYAFDVPLHESLPFATSAGDGINGVRVVWNFCQKDRAGNNPVAIAKLWHDQNWLAANPKDPLAICKKAFEEYDRLKAEIQNGRGSMANGSGVKTTDTRKTAVLIALGHKLLGWRRDGDVVTWLLHQASAADAALYDDRDLYRKLPSEPISYAKGAILGHKQMVKAIKEVQYARVVHGNRVATIGKDISKKDLEIIERLLYRK